MEAFLQTYGLWILLAGVFLAMHWFGLECGGGHGHGRPRENAAGKPGEEKQAATLKPDTQEQRAMKRGWIVAVGLVLALAGARASRVEPSGSSSSR